MISFHNLSFNSQVSSCIIYFFLFNKCADLKGGQGSLTPPPCKIRISLNYIIKLPKIASNPPWQTQITIGPPPLLEKFYGSAHVIGTLVSG